MELMEHQRVAVEWLRERLMVVGGAVLADDVGMGKSWVAAWLLREMGGGLVMCPRVLVEQWRELLVGVGVEGVRVESYGRVWRGRVERCGGLLVLDEAHHLRTEGTRVREGVRRLVEGGVGVLMLTATPVHNGGRDVLNLLGMVVGDGLRMAVTGARSWGELEENVERGRLLVGGLVLARGREVVSDGGGLRGRGRRECWVEAGSWGEREEWLCVELERVAGEWGGLGRVMLAMWYRRMESSMGALERSLRRVLRKAELVEEMLRRGEAVGRGEVERMLSRVDAGVEDHYQMGFVWGGEGEVDWGEVERWRGLRVGLMEVLGRGIGGWDREWLVGVLEVLRGDVGFHLVFTNYVHSARALWGQLDGWEGVERVVITRGWCAHSVWGRCEEEQAWREVRGWKSGVHRVLVVTPLASEGLNLPEVDSVVHLDFPATPARLEQRTGRADRLGAVGELRVTYRRPVERMERWTRTREILAKKWENMRRWRPEVGVGVEGGDENALVRGVRVGGGWLRVGLRDGKDGLEVVRVDEGERGVGRVVEEEEWWMLAAVLCRGAGVTAGELGKVVRQLQVLSG